MSALYARILLWHKLLATQTGGLALCSAKRALNRTEAGTWMRVMRDVADDIDQFLLDGTFALDDRGAARGSIQYRRSATGGITCRQIKPCQYPSRGRQPETGWRPQSCNEEEAMNFVLLAISYPIDWFFLAESTLRLYRAGFPIGAAYHYSVNR